MKLILINYVLVGNFFSIPSFTLKIHTIKYLMLILLNIRMIMELKKTQEYLKINTLSSLCIIKLPYLLVSFCSWESNTTD